MQKQSVQSVPSCHHVLFYIIAWGVFRLDAVVHTFYKWLQIYLYVNEFVCDFFDVFGARSRHSFSLLYIYFCLYFFFLRRFNTWIYKSVSHSLAFALGFYLCLIQIWAKKKNERALSCIFLMKLLKQRHQMVVILYIYYFMKKWMIILFGENYVEIGVPIPCNKFMAHRAKKFYDLFSFVI